MVFVTFVDEDAGDGSRAGVEVLVRAPRGKVDAPVVQLQRNVPDGVSAIERNETPLQTIYSLVEATRR